MKALVIGGTGAIGGHLSQLLADNNVHTVVTSRQHRNSKGNLHFLTGNAHESSFLHPLLQQPWDAIIDFMYYTTAQFAERSKRLLGSTSQYVYISSGRVYANTDGLITEQSPRLLDVSGDRDYLATDEYALAKARQENMLLHSRENNWTIIRPYITYSAKRLQLGVFEKEDWLYRALQGRTIVWSNDIHRKTTTMTHGLDVAKGILAIIGNPRALGETFHVTAPGSIAWSAVLDLYVEALEEKLGTRPNVIYQDTPSLIQWQSSPYQITHDRLFDRRFDNSKIALYVDTNAFTAAEVGLRRCLVRFLEKPEFGCISWKAEAIRDRQTGELSSMREMPGIWNKARYFKNRHLAR